MQTQVNGTLTGQASTGYLVEVFANTNSNPSGFGDGEYSLGFLQVMTNALGIGQFQFDGPTQPGAEIFRSGDRPGGQHIGVSRSIIGLPQQTLGNSPNAIYVEYVYALLLSRVADSGASTGSICSTAARPHPQWSIRSSASTRRIPERRGPGGCISIT